MRGSVLFSFALVLGVCQLGMAQDVVSASSGVVQYFEGTVLLDDKPVEHKAASFPSMKNGSVLHTEKGRAELLLTPGVYLRVDEQSSLHMKSNSLVDTRLEITQGSAILDTLNAVPGHPVTLVYQESSVHFPKPGIYRIDCDLGELQVYSGEASVAHEKTSTPVDPAHLYYFALELTTSKLGEGATDEFYDWAHNRSDAIADENQRASAEQDDAADADPRAGAGAGLFVAPPSSPIYAAPSSSALGSSLYGAYNNPFFINPPTPLLGLLATPGIVVFAPFRHRPGGSLWPITTGTGYRPTPVISRWPATGQFGSYLPGSALRLPSGISTYRSTSTMASRPIITGVPRPTAVRPGSSSIPRVIAAPHIGAIGHR